MIPVVVQNVSSYFFGLLTGGVALYTYRYFMSIKKVDDSTADKKNKFKLTKEFLFT